MIELAGYLVLLVGAVVVAALCDDPDAE